MLLSSPTPVGTGACPGVRPGALFFTEFSACTLSFLVRDGSNRFIATAGHCILEASGEMVWPPGKGPVAIDGADTRFGRFVYAALDQRSDFALVQLKPGVEASPKMCHFGGPVGLNNQRTNELVVLHHFGHGTGIGSVPGLNQPVLPARSAMASGMQDPRTVSAIGVAAPGDSGSPVISSDGRAVGVLYAIQLTGTIVMTRLPHELKRAERALGVDLNLMTASLEP
ncbi:MAG: S1 family peptidase [Actinomycetota bacterium]